MTAKRHLNKKTTGQKKILSAINKMEHESGNVISAQNSEDAIVKQFNRIQRGYSILMKEVVKEYDLIKDWIEKEATQRTEDLKHKITEKMPRF